MGLQLYRRHSKACKAKRPEDSRTGKFEEGRRGWKKCSCQIFASGALGGKFKRQCTEKWEWEKAEKLAAEWEEAGSWPNGSKQRAGVVEPTARGRQPEQNWPVTNDRRIACVTEPKSRLQEMLMPAALGPEATYDHYARQERS